MIKKKNQHIIPKCYLKHFQNNKCIVEAYNIDSKRFLENNIERVCNQNFAYEVSKKKVDNVLENEIAVLESEMSPYIDNLISKTLKNEIKREDINHHILFKYMTLLHVRTESNRIQFVRALFHYESLGHHMSLNELQNNQVYLKLFNAKFKEKSSLNTFLEFCYDKFQPEVRLGISKTEKFITSDNPVITFFIPDKENYVGIKYVLPIHPYICIYYIASEYKGISKEKQIDFPYIVKPETIYGYNQGIINVANHWIISSEPFTFLQNNQISKRFSS